MVNKMIPGGHYQHSCHTATSNVVLSEAISILSNDNFKKILMSSWVDNMGRGMMQMQGAWDLERKTITFTGTSADPPTDKGIPVKEIVTFVDNITQKMGRYVKENEKEFKTMLMILTRES